MALFKFELSCVWHEVNSLWTCGVLQRKWSLWLLAGMHIFLLGLKIDASSPVFAVSMALACIASMSLVSVGEIGAMKFLSARDDWRTSYWEKVSKLVIALSFLLLFVFLIVLMGLVINGLPESKNGVVFLILLYVAVSIVIAVLDIGWSKPCNQH